MTDSIGTGIIHHYDSVQLMLYLYSKLGWERDFRFDRTLGFLAYLTESEWGVNWNSDNVPLPSEGYWLIKQDPRERPEPGDRVSFRVRVENRCPLSLARGRDIPSLLIKSVPGTDLMYSGTEAVPGLEVLNDYLWKYNDFNEGDRLEFTYQAQIPDRYRSGDYYQSTIYARGFSGYLKDLVKMMN